MAWYDNAVFYHIYPLGLCGCAHENDGQAVPGAFNKLNAWAEHAADLGCTAIYIGPLFESGSHGYDTIDYRLVDRRLGTNEEFKAFVAACHARGQRVIVDGVFNHVGRDFFAFQDLKANRENARYKDWFCDVNFWGNNEYNDGFSYGNWGGFNLLVKLNQRNPEVQDYHFDTVRFWVEEFDIGVYNREAYAERTRREFRQLLSNAQVFYCFQPIFSARSGRVVAYEALMRSDLPTLRSPATIMKLAREQGALYEIERLTFTKALETFDSLCRAGSVSGDAMLFVNSIASTCLTQEDVDYIDSRWHELRRRMVIEITEEEAIDYEALERKRNAPGFSGMFALDDYGSGYSNENTLLQLAPRFVKVDITIIRGIDTSPDKQQILRNMVAYAHPRSMKIVAEGVETAAELRTVIELGADLLQGYFLARPAIVPGAIAPEAAGIIQELQRRKKD